MLRHSSAAVPSEGEPAAAWEWCWGVPHLRLHPGTAHSHGRGSWVCRAGVRWSLCPKMLRPLTPDPDPTLTPDPDPSPDPTLTPLLATALALPDYSVGLTLTPSPGPTP